MDANAPINPSAVRESRFTLDRSIIALKRRLVEEASGAIAMLESALDALWKLDEVAAREVRRRDDTIDRQEVEIEQECIRMLALQQPFARDLRFITFILKVNADVERVADHASSIAKMAAKLAPFRGFTWPTALVELGQRVPLMCHTLLRAVLDEDAELAHKIVHEDETIDGLEKQLFAEVEEFMRAEPDQLRCGLLMYRTGRELERIGDLMKNIAEDIIYLATGAIVRHEQKRAAQAVPPPPP
ncbi:MAG: phosphate signaling complex protein PhoU [Phycisphaerales bacterium]|nr:phosphate signaling complex protein PhoU [Phycisphaerales bacterium]